MRHPPYLTLILKPGQGQRFQGSIVWHNQSGQSLIQALASVAIMGVVMAAFATVMSSQQQEVQALTQKMAAMDLEKLLIQSLSDGNVCKYITNNPSVLTFDANAVSPTSPQVITPTLPIYASVQTGPPMVLGPVVAQPGEKASALTSSLVIRSIKLEISNGAGSSYLGNWVVDFEPAGLIRAVQPVKVSTRLTVDASIPSAAKIIGCGSSAPGGALSLSMWAAGNRCRNDNVGAICSYNPEMGSWTYELCETTAWLTTYGGELRWWPAGNGYIVVPVGCAPNTMCPHQGASPYKVHAFCLEGFE